VNLRDAESSEAKQKHVGQIVHIGKILTKKPWVSLSIPKGESVSYNTTKFAESNNKNA
jgi:hypothetical protein